MTSPIQNGPQAPGFYRYRVGKFEAIALHDGVASFDRPAGFIRNASDEAAGEAFASAGMPREKLTLTFSALAVHTGEQLVLIDTGIGDATPFGTGALNANLKAAGYAPEDVGTVIISHFHLDHISGLRGKDGTLTYPNATIWVPQGEWDFWMDDAKMASAPEAMKNNFEIPRRIFEGMDAQLRRYQWGDTLLAGFTSVQADGHTPGMSAIEIESDGAKLLFVADITNNPLIFVRHPEWQAMFDMAPDDAVATRRRLLDRAAAEKLRLFFYHAPFPSTGTVVKNGDGYEYLPALWTAN